MIQLLDDHEHPIHGYCASASIGFAACSTAALILSPLARNFAQDTAKTWISAVLYMSLVIAAGMGSSSLRLLAQPPESRSVYASFFGPFFRIALWAAPSVTLAWIGGPLGLIVSGAYAAAVSRFLKKVSDRGPTPMIEVRRFPEFESVVDSDFLGASGSTTRLTHLSELIFLAYVGIVFQMAGLTIPAIVCASASSFILTWILYVQHERKVSPTRNRTLVLAVQSVLAVCATFIALTLGQGSGTSAEARGSAPQKTGPGSGGLHSGIILFNRQEVVSLDVQPRRSPDVGPMRTLRKSMSIPFSGEYWFFRWPYIRPPQNSFKSEGDPTTTSVFIHSYHPMQMQAWQKLNAPIGIDCCSSIRLVLHNADSQSDAVQIELLLIDSSRHNRNSQTLGQQSLANPSQSILDQEFGFPSQAFQFAIPAQSQIRSFDTIEVLFRLKPPRMNKGATVSIQRFELMP